MNDYFDLIFAGFDEERALDAVARAEEAAARARAEAESQRQLLEAYRAWKAIHASTAGTLQNNPKAAQASDRDASRGLPGKSDSPTGRDAIRRFFQDHPDSDWSIPEIANAMGLSAEAHRRLGLSLMRLARDGELAKPRKGLYRLPPATVTAEAGEERGSALENGSQRGSGVAVRSSELFGLARPAPGVEPGSSG